MMRNHTADLGLTLDAPLATPFPTASKPRAGAQPAPCIERLDVCRAHGIRGQINPGTPMDYVVFARFADRSAAGKCLREVHATIGKGLSATVHYGASDSASFDQIVQHTADFTQTDRRHALVVGIATATVAGAVLGVVLVSIGLFPSTLPQGALFGAMMGLALGLVAMLILGAGFMDRRLRRLTAGLHRGEVVVTMHVPGRDAMDRATTVLAAHGAAFAEKSLA